MISKTSTEATVSRADARLGSHRGHRRRSSLGIGDPDRAIPERAVIVDIDHVACTKCLLGEPSETLSFTGLIRFEKQPRFP